MKKILVAIFYLFLTVVSFSERVKVNISTEIPGNLYIDDREIKKMEIGEIFRSRYLTGNYIFTLKNSSGVYQKKVELKSGENNLVFSKKDLIESMVKKPVKKATSKQEKKPIPQQTKVEITDKVTTEKVEITEKNSQIKPKVEKKEIKITKDNFTSLLIKDLKNGTALNTEINIEKFDIVENPETDRTVFIVSRKTGEKIEKDSYFYYGYYNNRPEEPLGILKIQIKFNIKDEYFREMVKFFKSFPHKLAEEIDVDDTKNISEDYSHLYIVDNERFKDTDIIDEDIIYNHIELREVNQYLKQIPKLYNFNLTLKLKDKNNKVVKIEKVSEHSNINYSYKDYSNRNIFKLFLTNNNYFENTFYVKLPKKHLDRIETVELRSFYDE